MGREVTTRAQRHADFEATRAQREPWRPGAGRCASALLAALLLASSAAGDQRVAPEGRQQNIAPEQNVASKQRTVTVLVAYHSVKGHTRAMAEAVAAGARSVAGAEVRLRTVAEAETEDVLWADAIAVGSPVYNANMVPEVQSFINAWPFRGAPMKDKIGAAFVSGGAISAGEETVQLSILRSMLVFGMVVTGGPAWRSAFGASAVTEEEPFSTEAVAERFLEKGRALGRRLAELGLRFSAAPER